MGVSTKGIQDMFSEWLSEHLSPAQMSEIYITYYDIDSYLQREGILSSSLLDTVDLDKIASIKKMIATNGKFRFIHRNKIDKYAKAVSYYHTWLSENQDRIHLLSAASERIQTSVSSDAKEEQQKKFVERTTETEENDNEVKFVCFGEGNSYAFTQVEYFEYFGTRQYNVKSWKKLYTDVLRCLIEDYPMEIKNLKGKSIGEGTRIDIGSWEQSLKMNSPRMFETDMYVETNLNATNILDKIKHLLDLCRVDSENLVIAYSLKKEANIEKDVSKTDENKAEEMIQKKAESIIDEATEIAERRKQFSEWLSSKGKDQGTILVSLMDISKMNKMALNKGITDKNIYFVENPSALKIISGRLQRCSSFLEIDIRLQKQYKKTLENFIEFRATQMEERDNEIAVIRDIKPALQVNQNVELLDEEKNLSIILQEDYENGFRLNSAIDKGRIKIYYRERFSEEIALSDEKLIATLKKIGTVRDNRVFAKQDGEQIDLLNQIYEAVIEVFDNGASCVYVEAIYQKYQIELADKLQIYDTEVLANTLVGMSKERLRRKQTFLCLKNKQTNLENDVLNMFKQSPVPLSYNDIQEIMWYVPIEKIKYIMVTTKSIAYVGPETYFYAPNLPVNQEEIMAIKQLIRQKLECKSHVTDVELRQMIETNLPGVAINTSEFTTYGLRNCLGDILRADYQFNGPIISAYGKELGMAEVFAEYCTDREQVTADELKNFASEMDTVIYWDAVREKTIRVSEELLLRDDQIDFDIDATDSVLESLSDKEYIPLKDIGLFMHFPSLSVQWNGYVLESFLYKYSRRFKLLHASFSASGFFGAMVRMDSQIEDYRTLIVDVLAHSNQWTEKKDALELLVKEGYQQRRHYADIEKVLHEAKLLREKINDMKKRG